MLRSPEDFGASAGLLSVLEPPLFEAQVHNIATEAGARGGPGCGVGSVGQSDSLNKLVAPAVMLTFLIVFQTPYMFC